MDSDIIRYLKKLPLFQGMPEPVIVDMAQEVTVRKLAKDEVLFRKGDPGDALYMIRTGWVKIVTEDNDGDELVLNHSGPTEVIGEMAVIDGEPRSAGVVALTPVDILELKRETFMSALRKQPLLALDIMRNLSARMRYATTYIEKAIEWSHRIAEGDYGFAIDQIQTERSTIVDTRQANEARARELLSAFFEMVEGVKAREENLMQQLQQLSIEIDDKKRQQEFENLTESTFFTNLKSAAIKLRQQREAEEE
ncbi:MAG: cyclic nucleotide-binding domain-containing protein [Chloroflexi bacterium]|nr:cyclic nucleotide-binding domain-containing protein [Chloroflexota bacterium]MCI0580745.1 cyclic nucleotide-binding domain-containing protein [Chloroflexota bacterium]MCI0650016.1 cyclic nucleotide-binding domain-containing protein [Chloroflexota bacterium]MCI0730480.1 cyclic nucleotide-binding domain-containing protein [Chloroflexota bacterium]